MPKDSRPLHLVYYSYHLDPRAGGPTGYLANLKIGLDKIPNPEDFSIWFLTGVAKNKSKNNQKTAIFAFIKQKISSFNKLNRFYTNFIGRSKRKGIAKRTKYFLDLCSNEIQNETLKIFIQTHQNIKSIHCHTFIDAAEAHSTLLAMGKRNQIKIILTSHMPEAPSIELSNSYRESGLSEKHIQPFTLACEKLQTKTFSAVDAIIFPSKESMEPYYQTVENFDQLINNKKILFLITGSIGLTECCSKEEAKEKLGIPSDNFIVSYIGRHNGVKGYDLLCKAAYKVFEQNYPISFVVAGRENRLYPSPQHPQWKELGWVNPATVLKASDLFVLSNRRTYFDLIMLEALSLGSNILATNTGGNKTIFKLTNSISLVEANPEEIANEIIDQYNHPEKRKKAEDVQEQFKRWFCETEFAKNYINLIQNYYKDEGLL